MPIFSYFAVVGSVLVALLFVADAKLPKQGPALVSSDVYGLPKPWRPDPPKLNLAANPAPEPDMTSEAVKAAMPKIAAVNERMTTADAAPKKKRVARKQPQPQPDDDRQNFAWSRGGNDGGPFGGSPFGRF
jgi:hypothetical protein